MGRFAVDLTGRKFGRLVVIRPAGKRGRNAVSLCQCKCGVEKTVMNFNLLSERTQSCGCLHRENASARVKKNPPRLKHGLRRTITYNCWQGMIARCIDSRCVNYPRYGGRGITVCSRWSDPDKGLLNFVEDMGQRPTPAHSIDRIDSEKGYEPGNCRWATRSQQNQNVGLKRSNTTGFKGIHKDKKKWAAEIRNNGTRYHLGNYKTPRRAALAYNIASEELHGPYGVRNPLPSMPKRLVCWIYKRVHKILKGDLRDVG